MENYQSKSELRNQLDALDERIAAIYLEADVRISKGESGESLMALDDEAYDLKVLYSKLEEQYLDE